MGKFKKEFCPACEKPDRRLVVLSTDYKCLDCGGKFTHYEAPVEVKDKCKECGEPYTVKWKAKGDETGMVVECSKCGTKYVELFKEGQDAQE